MISDIYKIDGKYPDPYEIESKLNELKVSPEQEKQYKQALKEVQESGFDSHPLLGKFFVES